jgi:hypothetical protein
LYAGKSLVAIAVEILLRSVRAKPGTTRTLTDRRSHASFDKIRRRLESRAAGQPAMKKIQRGAVSEVQASLELEKMKTVEWLLANDHQLCDSPRRELARLAGR